MITFHVVTLFPQAFKSYLGESIIARAIREKKIAVKFYNPRDFTEDKWARVDRRPYGGGPGMVLEAPALIASVDKAMRNSKHKVLNSRQVSNSKSSKPKIVIFSTSGKQFTNVYAKSVVKRYTDIILVCGRYEGVDARVKKIFKAEEVSVGPYVLTGGELPAEIFIDAVSRQIEGVLGNFDSVEERRVASSEVYTRPEVIKYNGKIYKVPKILLSGHHGKIDAWKAGKKQ